jgi:predicted lipoprotein with Yx(FWY)xxD motif
MRRLIVCLAIATTIAGCASAPKVARSTPPGVSLVDVIPGGVASGGASLWRYLATSTGKPLYTFDADGNSGKASCADDCTREFKPYLALVNAQVSADWSLIARGQKERQWAYRGQPLYFFDGKDPGTEKKSAEKDESDDENKPADKSKAVALRDPSSALFSPKKGWRRAKFAPEESLPTPSGIGVKSLAVSNGYILVNESSEMPLYVMEKAPKKPAAWVPMYASLLAQPVGDFSILSREDGTRQWAYKGRRLYSYAGDYSPDDLNGLGTQADVQPALAYENFMPSSVRVRIYAGRGPLLVTSQGRSLYTVARTVSSMGGNGDGFFVRGGAYRVVYEQAKEVGTRACERECLKTWSPLLAAAQDQASGFWEITDRADGLRQWAYKGSPLYTYSGDDKPGDINGNAIEIPVLGDATGKTDLSLTGGDLLPVQEHSGSGWYWHIVTFYN